MFFFDFGVDYDDENGNENENENVAVDDAGADDAVVAVVLVELMVNRVLSLVVSEVNTIKLCL